MTTKQARWKCPQCGAGILAPTKPRRDDVRRYCLPCSAKGGRLVERIAPALEAKREQRAAFVSEKARQKRQVARRRAEPKKAQERCDAIRRRIIEKEAVRIWKHMKEWHKGKPLPRIEIVRGRDWGRTRGYAGGRDIQIGVDPTQNDDRSKWTWALLAHELAHIACPPIYRLDKTDNTHHQMFYYCLREAWMKRWKVDINFREVKQWGYSVDRIIEQQGWHAVRFVLPNPITPIGQDDTNNNTEGNNE